MTRDDNIINMAVQAGISEAIWFYDYDVLERFAALVAAEKEAQMIRDGWRKCAEGQRTTQFCALLEEAVKAEREACAKVAESFGKELVDGQDVAAAIRARGEQEQLPYHGLHLWQGF